MIALLDTCLMWVVMCTLFQTSQKGDNYLDYVQYIHSKMTSNSMYESLFTSCAVMYHSNVMGVIMT